MASAKRGGEWGVVVRLADGRRLYYSPDSGRQGQEEWSPRASQAQRYDTREDAELAAANFTTNAHAQECVAVPLT